MLPPRVKALILHLFQCGYIVNIIEMIPVFDYGELAPVETLDGLFMDELQPQAESLLLREDKKLLGGVVDFVVA